VVTALIILSIISFLLWLLHIVCSFSFYLRERDATDYIEDIPRISVVIPAFNENPEFLKATLNSLLEQKRVCFEVIVVDDGSAEPVQVDEHHKIKLIRLATNCGKRRAQMYGIECAEYDWIATIDSDTILDPLALFYLYCAIKHQNVDAVTGTIFVANRHQNLLTKLISCMYGLSIFQQRAEQSFYRTVTCCSGALSMYRKSLMLDNKEDYLTQQFFGRHCRAGDDRHMTSMFLLSGHGVGWTSKARCWTKTPATLRSILKQQIRWVRSNTIEMTYLFPRMSQWSWPFSFFTLKLIFIYAHRIFMYIATILLTIQLLSPIPVVVISLAIIMSALAKCFIEYFWNYNVTRQTSGFNYLIGYVLFEFFVLAPAITYGIMTPYVVGWLTRNSKNSQKISPEKQEFSLCVAKQGIMYCSDEDCSKRARSLKSE
jgi:cellulose synthase/poly-beta-1,6-N-acetylglucosamine synthase-like glycosyltransferase